MLQEEQQLMEDFPEYGSSGYMSTGGNGWIGDSADSAAVVANVKGTETGVAPLYLDLLSLVPALRNRNSVPLMHQFLEESQCLQVPNPTLPTGDTGKENPPPPLPVDPTALRSPPGR